MELGQNQQFAQVLAKYLKYLLMETRQTDSLPYIFNGEIMSKTTRRDFIRTTSALAAGAGLANLNILRPERVMGANGRVRVAIVGAGDRMMGALVPSFFKLAEENNFELV